MYCIDCFLNICLHLIRYHLTFVSETQKKDENNIDVRAASFENRDGRLLSVSQADGRRC